MAKLVVLDAGPIGLLCLNRGDAAGDRCKAWLEGLFFRSAIVCSPEIAVYEVRRELLRLGRDRGLSHLEALIENTLYLPINRTVMTDAAELWALLRRQGRPTASPESLDADCILAAHARHAAGIGDVVSIATTNVSHLSRFPGVDARHWDDIG